MSDAKAPADVFIQWKGTDVCLDFHCYQCQTSSHYDGYFAYALKCPRCGTVYELPSVLPLRHSQRPAQFGCVKEMPDEATDSLEQYGRSPGPPLECQFHTYDDDDSGS